ncbi:MAG: hypothetical protein HYV07_18140 [Deltaproteobacteria bacterium]|nr:hypothetical protein [Deltaproteobacteria bacterium]
MRRSCLVAILSFGLSSNAFAGPVATGSVALALEDPEEPGGFRAPEPPPPPSVPEPPPPSTDVPAPEGSLASPASGASPRLAPWIVLGVGVVAMAVGVYLVTETSAALDALAASPLRVDEVAARQSDVMTVGLGASVLLSIGTAAIVSGIALLTF